MYVADLAFLSQPPFAIVADSVARFGDELGDASAHNLVGRLFVEIFSQLIQQGLSAPRLYKRVSDALYGALLWHIFKWIHGFSEFGKTNSETRLAGRF